MRQRLQPHPDTPCTALTGIHVDVERRNGTLLVLTYRAAGDIGAVWLPAAVVAARGDALWKHSCFEAFVGASGDAYSELNFSPSGLWAAYNFTGYRSGMTEAMTLPPRSRLTTSADALELHVEIDLRHLPGITATADWQLGLSAVIEEKHGGKSYWALVHPPGKPDFHHRDCLAVRLNALGGA
jgi:hypothetical protein